MKPGPSKTKARLAPGNGATDVVKYKNHPANFQELSAELIEALRSLSPIEQVVAEHVKLRRSGAELIGCCPFHADKFPSFGVNPAKGVFCCHACGAGGDVYQFIELLLKCGFREALSHLAERAGLETETFKPSPELTAKVQAMTARRTEEAQFERFCRERIEEINRHYRNLGRAATHAEECLRAGTLSAYEQELAWDALERFRTFQLRVEREGLADVSLLRREWEQNRAAA